MYLGRFKVHYMWGKWKIMKVKHWLVTKIFFIIIAEKCRKWDGFQLIKGEFFLGGFVMSWLIMAKHFHFFLYMNVS